MEFNIENANQMMDFGKFIAEYFLKKKDNIVLCLDGELGSGKTTFSQGFAKGLGILKKVKSPTYTYVLEYDSIPKFIHMDAYRLNEFSDFDFSILDEGYCLIEWSNNIKKNIPKNALYLNFSYTENGRKIIIEGDEYDFSNFYS